MVVCGNAVNDLVFCKVCANSCTVLSTEKKRLLYMLLSIKCFVVFRTSRKIKIYSTKVRMRIRSTGIRGVCLPEAKFTKLMATK